MVGVLLFCTVLFVFSMCFKLIGKNKYICPKQEASDPLSCELSSLSSGFWNELCRPVLLSTASGITAKVLKAECTGL